jgi:hypothetical protein
LSIILFPHRLAPDYPLISKMGCVTLSIIIIVLIFSSKPQEKENFMSIKLLSRNDDFGSTRAANRAMLEAAECGFITRNISCMAPAPYIAEGAEDYYSLADPLYPPTNEDENAYMEGVENWLSCLSGNKQYLYLAHPAYPSEEALLMYAADTPKGKIRQERGMEYKAVTSPRWERWLAQFDLQPVRYSEADKQGRQNLKKILVG